MRSAFCSVILRCILFYCSPLRYVTFFGGGGSVTLRARKTLLWAVETIVCCNFCCCASVSGVVWSVWSERFCLFIGLACVCLLVDTSADAITDALHLHSIRPVLFRNGGTTVCQKKWSVFHMLDTGSFCVSSISASRVTCSLDADCSRRYVSVRLCLKCWSCLARVISGFWLLS